MLEDIGLMRAGLEVVGGICVSAMGWLVKGHSDRLKKIEDETKETRNDLSAHEIENERYKLEAEQRFAKDVTVQATLARLHERIDDIGVDVKTILRRCGEVSCGTKS